MAKKKNPNENIVMTRVDPEVKRKLKRMAKDQDRNLSYIVKKLLTQAVA